MPTILIVEDDLDIRDALQEILVDEGFQVKTASHGREALGYLNAGLNPGLILLDLMMPEMNGWEFAEAFHRGYGARGTPIIALSADANIQAKANTLGARGFLRKPVRIEELLAVIARELKGP